MPAVIPLPRKELINHRHVMPVIDKVSRNPMKPTPPVTTYFMFFPDYRTGTAIYTGIRGVIKKISVNF